jgi:hypothetical protein
MRTKTKVKKKPSNRKRSSDSQIRKIEEKVLAGKQLSTSERAALPLLLQRIARSADVLRALSWITPYDEQSARELFVRQTIFQVRLIELLPPEKLFAVSKDLLRFPMLVSPRTSKPDIQTRLETVRLGDAFGPRFKQFDGRWKADYLAEIAVSVLQQKYGLPFPRITASGWQKERESIRKIVRDHAAHSFILEILKPLFRAEGDRRYPSRLKERVIERVLEKCQWMLVEA